MASHKGWDRLYPVKSVALSGGSFRLAKGQLALIDLEAVPTTSGLKIIDSLDGLPKDNRFQLRVGKHEIKNNRSQSSKDWSTETFKIENVIKLDVDAPSNDFKTDEFILGWDGFNDDSAINLINGDNEEIGLSLQGEVIGMIGYSESLVEIKTYLEAPNTGDFTNQEIVEGAVKRLQNYKLMGDIPLTNYLDITPINSENSATTGSDKVFYNLKVKDYGNSNDLAKVQSQYDAVVVRSSRDDVYSTYTIIADKGADVTSGAFVVGDQYIITALGGITWSTVGATGTLGEVFTATAIGAVDGTSTAAGVDIADFSENEAWTIKGCATCPTGYSAFTDGYIYSVALEDNGVDSTATVEGISSNAEADSAVAVNVTDGVTTYTFINSEVLTEVEKVEFIDANESAVIELVAEDVQSVCSPDNVTSTAWGIGSVCKIESETYSIILADDECGVSKLDALVANYPDMTSLSADTQANCQTKYIGDVVTNIVCEECDVAFTDLFVSEAPGDFEGKPWSSVDKVYSETAKMGIKFKAKKVVMSGSEEYRDGMPYIASSARLSLGGGFISNLSESFSTGRHGRFAVTILTIGTEPENWGGNLREFEDITKRYEEGVSRHEGNNYGKFILGEETMLDGVTPYVDYILTVKTDKYAQSFSGQVGETFYYHFAAPIGVHVQVEALLNAIALQAGVNPVQAYAND